MKKEKIIATIKAVEYYNRTSYGNPSKLVAFVVNGVCKIGRTAPNSSAGYVFCSYSIERDYEITYHYTKSGKLLIDYAKEI